MKSLYFKDLEQAALIGEDLTIKEENGKLDLDSDNGQEVCKNFLECIERLFQISQVKTESRKYRQKFSKAYKVLYKEDQMCYLTEILDSAQEGFPFLWVNGEKYVFSKEVIEAGRTLFNNFCKILYQVKDAY